MSDLIVYYVLIELSTSASRHSPATTIVYREFLELWIRPYWSTTDIRDVRTGAVEHWLSKMRRQNKGPLCNSTKAKIRSLMSVLFNHALRYEWLEHGKNPIKFVRQSVERLSTPEVLEPSEILIPPSNIAADRRFPHTWSDSCRILLISSSLLWRIEAE